MEVTLSPLSFERRVQYDGHATFVGCLPNSFGVRRKKGKKKQEEEGKFQTTSVKGGSRGFIYVYFSDNPFPSIAAAGDKSPSYPARHKTQSEEEETKMLGEEAE